MSLRRRWRPSAVVRDTNPPLFTASVALTDATGGDLPPDTDRVVETAKEKVVRLTHDLSRRLAAAPVATAPVGMLGGVADEEAKTLLEAPVGDSRSLVATADTLERVRDALDSTFVLKPRPRRMWNIVGLMAGFGTATGVLLQIAKVLQRNAACDLALGTIVMNLIVINLWLAYAIANRLPVNIVTSCVGIVVMTALLILKVKYSKPRYCADK